MPLNAALLLNIETIAEAIVTDILLMLITKYRHNVRCVYCITDSIYIFTYIHIIDIRGGNF